MNSNKQSVNITTAVLFFLMGLNFMNWFKYLAIIIFVKEYLITVKYEVGKISINALLIFLFCTFYCLFAPSDILPGIKATILIFSYYLGYLVGKKVIDTENTNENLIVNYVFVLAFGFASFGALNLIYNLKRSGLYGFERIMPDFWTGELYGATAQSSLFLLLSGIAFYVIVILKKHLFLKITVLVGILILILNALLTASRTAIVYPILILLFSSISYLILSKKIQLKSFLIFILIIGFMFFSYESNLLGIKNFVSELPLYDRLNSPDYIQLSEDGRIGVYSFFIQNMLYYPLGGLNKINPILYMHNLWLDVYAVSGIFPFILLLLFTGRIFINGIHLIKNPRVDDGFKTLLVGTYLSFFFLFMSEPVLLANPWFFVIFCVIGGMTDKYLANIRRTTVSLL